MWVITQELEVESIALWDTVFWAVCLCFILIEDRKKTWKFEMLPQQLTKIKWLSTKIIKPKTEIRNRAIM